MDTPEGHSRRFTKKDIKTTDENPVNIAGKYAFLPEISRLFLRVPIKDLYAL